MKITKRIIAVMLSVMFIVLCFAGCSTSEKAEEISAQTLLIAYTEDKAPFIYEEDGQLKGFDVEIMEKIFRDVKNDYKNYKFVKVDKDYKIGEDVYCVDSDGKECIAYVMAGGVQKDVGDINNSYTFTNDIINNAIITVTKSGYGISNYADLNGKEIGVVTDAAKAALNKNSAIKDGCKSIAEYDADNVSNAIADLDSGKIKALVIDEFNFCVLENKDDYSVLNGELDNTSYAYAFKKWDWYVEPFNEAIYELKSPDYNDADEFTPIVEKYFGYNASNFDFKPVKD